MKYKKDAELIAAVYGSILENNNDTELTRLATIGDEALDNKWGYGRSTPGNTFGWQANLKSAEYAAAAINSGETDIERISDEVHKGWNETAKRFVQDPDQFDDTPKARAKGTLDGQLVRRKELMNKPYSDLSEDDKEKDRVVARAILQAIKGNE